jgi:sugar lactone lactonase YvrE
MCIDIQGNLNVAMWGGKQVVVINPLFGRIIEEIKVPALQVTCPTFGGTHLSRMFITSASFSRNEKSDGRLFSIERLIPGRKTYLFG